MKLVTAIIQPHRLDEVMELADRITQVLTATREQYSAMQQHSLEAVKVHDLDRTLDTFEALYRGETPAK